MAAHKTSVLVAASTVHAQRCDWGGCTTAARGDALAHSGGAMGPSVLPTGYLALATGAGGMNLVGTALSCRASLKEQAAVLKMCSHALVFPQLQ